MTYGEWICEAKAVMTNALERFAGRPYDGPIKQQLIHDSVLFHKSALSRLQCPIKSSRIESSPNLAANDRHLAT